MENHDGLHYPRCDCLYRNTLDEEHLRQILYGSQERIIESGSERGYDSHYDSHYESQYESHYEEPPRSHHHDANYDPTYEDPHQHMDDFPHERKLSNPQLRQFSREPTVIRLSERAAPEENNNAMDYDNVTINRCDCGSSTLSPNGSANCQSTAPDAVGKVVV